MERRIKKIEDAMDKIFEMHKDMGIEVPKVGSDIPERKESSTSIENLDSPPPKRRGNKTKTFAY